MFFASRTVNWILNAAHTSSTKRFFFLSTVSKFPNLVREWKKKGLRNTLSHLRFFFPGPSGFQGRRAGLIALFRFFFCRALKSIAAPNPFFLFFSLIYRGSEKFSGKFSECTAAAFRMISACFSLVNSWCNQLRARGILKRERAPP